MGKLRNTGRVLALCGLVSISLVRPPPAVAQADGPDFWRVVGVRANDTLNLRSGPSARSSVIARIPHDARRLKNLGCRGEPTFAAWLKMTPAQKERARRARWCEVEYGGRRGWVAGRFLREDG